MTSRDCVQKGTRLQCALERFYNILCSIHEHVQKENEEQKLLIAHLRRLHSNFSDCKCYGKEGSLQDDVVHELPLTEFPELERLDQLLRKSGKIKHKFITTEQESGKKKPGQAKEICERLTLQPGDAIRYKKAPEKSKGRLLKSTTCSVISSKKLHQLNELVRQPTTSLPNQRNDCYTSKENLFLQLLQEHVELKAKLRSSLDNKRSETSEKFLRKVESSLCQDWIQSLEKGSVELNDKHMFMFPVMDKTTDLLFADSHDTRKMLTQYSKQRISVFESLVHEYMEKHILPDLEELNSKEGIPTWLLKDFLELCTPGILEH